MVPWRASGRAAGAGFYRRLGSLPRLAALALAASAALGPSCQSVPVTGRSQFNTFSVEQDKKLGAEAYEEILAQSRVVRSGPEVDLVRRVVSRLAAVSDDPGFEWEANVIDEPETVNAWCMPGGKIAVYTGILPVTEDETGLAVVLGHEIAHAIARHGTERMSTQGAAQVGLAIASQTYETVAQYQQAIGVAANLFVFMPWGRKHELEADRIGLIYMARAGYDPRQAIGFWKRMDALGGGQAPPEFLSTHPSGSSRIEQIEDLMPQALAEYRESGSGATGVEL
jgi:predicted Zn-dependent protease